MPAVPTNFYSIPSFQNGDVNTSDSSAALTIAAGAVTNAKIQNESAATLLGNPTGSGAAPSEITLGSGLAFSGSTLTSSGSGGTVTTVSVVSANGLAGTVANATTTPAITLSTTINAPVLAGNGTAISAATTTGTGSVVLSNSPTLVTPALGTPSSGVGTNITGLNAANISTGTIPSARLGVTSRPFAMPTVANTTGNNIALDAYASFGYTVNEIDGIATSSGTCTVAIQINGTNVTGLGSISVTSTPRNITATAANTVSAGNRVSVVITSNSSGANLEFTMKATRT